MALLPLRHLIFSRWSAFVHDLCWIPLSLYAAYLLRFNFEGIPPQYLASLRLLCLVAIPVQGIVFWQFNLYRALWRFASVPDLERIAKSVLLGSTCLAAIAAFLTHLQGIPRSVLVLYPLILLLGLCLPRMFYRWYKDRRLRLNAGPFRRVIIVGAGQAGELLLRDILNKPDICPVALVDDDSEKQGREIRGIRVRGTSADLPELCAGLGADEIMVAIPSASPEDLNRILDHCARTPARVRILPSLYELTDSNHVGAELLRSPELVDLLLGRHPVELDNQAISGYLRGRRVFISGGGGSIGSELCRQVARMGPERLVVFDNSEYNLFTIEQELDGQDRCPVEAVLGDVRNRFRVRQVLERHRPDVVFHAAAYKHVPMLEVNPCEAVLNNIHGTRVLAEEACRAGVDRFVFISTDKAVNPANIMGATKRVAELYCRLCNDIPPFPAQGRQEEQGRTTGRTRFIITRFGNVLDSAGSVVPIFRKQIAAGGPVTVTHQDMTRYFMTIPEAVSLILQAGGMGRGGEIFVLDMGEPVRIMDLARKMVRLATLGGGPEVEIRITGLRPGEKLAESLFHDHEELEPTAHERLNLALCQAAPDPGRFADLLEEMTSAARAGDPRRLVRLLQEILPDFQRSPFPGPTTQEP